MISYLISKHHAFFRDPLPNRQLLFPLFLINRLLLHYICPHNHSLLPHSSLSATEAFARCSAHHKLTHRRPFVKKPKHLSPLLWICHTEATSRLSVGTNSAEIEAWRMTVFVDATLGVYKAENALSRKTMVNVQSFRPLLRKYSWQPWTIFEVLQTFDSFDLLTNTFYRIVLRPVHF